MRKFNFLRALIPSPLESARGRLFTLLYILPILSQAQEKLTLQQAIEIALKNNYSIVIANNESQIARNDVTYGNAGFLPQVGLNASGSFSNYDTKLELATGATVDRKGAKSDNIAPGLVMTWTLFDGMKMFATYDKLKELSAMGELNAKMQMENTIEQLIYTYYDIVMQKQLLTSTDSTLAIYAERVNIAKTKWDIGNGSKSDYLQAQVDRNAQKSVRLKQENNLYMAKVKLNRLLSRPSATDFDVNNEIEVNTALQLNELKTTSEKQNSSLLFYQKNVLASELTLKELRALRYPRLLLNANYNFSLTHNQAGVTLFTRNLGWNTGLTATWSIFNGFNTNRILKNAQLTITNSRLTYEDTKTGVEADLMNAYKNYQSSLEAFSLEQQNSALAKENVEIALQRFRLGSATSLEMKEAQKSYDDALSRLIQTRYDAKQAETKLMKLKGELVK